MLGVARSTSKQLFAGGKLPNVSRRIHTSVCQPRASLLVTAVPKPSALTPAQPPICGRRSFSSRRRLQLRAALLPGATIATGITAAAPDMMQAAITSKFIAMAVALGSGLLTAIAWLDAKWKTQKPGLQYTPTEFHERVLRCCPTLHQPYRPVPFMTNPHVETILAAKTRRRPPLAYRREILMTGDGGCVALDWEHVQESCPPLPDHAPVLVLLPGLTGGSGDSYVLHAVASARRAGMRAVVFNGRGTADSPVLTQQFYSASFTGDTRAVIAHVARRFPRAPLLAAGWSLGANILLRYLGEEGAATPLSAAVSLCNPFNLPVSNENLTRGFNRLYDLNLAHSLQRIFRKHAPLWAAAPPPFRPAAVPDCHTIRAFDQAITIHSFGWPSVDDYYAGSSSCHSVPHVTVPTLCIQALDDPIAPRAAIPFAPLLANPHCLLVTTLTGGHLGWVAGEQAPFGAPWTDKVMFEWLTAVVAELQPQRQPAGKELARQEQEDGISAPVPAPAPAAAAAAAQASAPVH